MNIDSWNCRGLGNSSKVEVVKDLLRMNSPDVLLLQETKIDEDSLLSLRKKNWKKNAWIAVSAWGSYDGIVALWTKNIFSLKNSLVMQQRIFSELQHIPSNISIVIFNLYVPVNFQDKRECWNSLIDFIAANSLSNVMVAGDLNIMMGPKEKKGGICGRHPTLKMVENFISLWDLIDFKPKNGRYT